jgi:predicted phosphodiesterase
MKITVVSDLHLEWGYQRLPGGEVLILAGDIAEKRSISNALHSTKPVGYLPGAYKCWDFFEYECAKYEKVFYVLGNHEHYHSHFHKTKNELKELLNGYNITILENECEEYKGVLFIGSTLWTDCNRGDPMTTMTLKHSMQDYKAITYHNKAMDVYHKLSPEHTAEVHLRSKEYIFKIVELNKDKPIVVITHHAPSFTSVNEKYAHDKEMNGGYASELSDIILDCPQIKLWCHGHMHDPVDYMIGETRVLSNPKGYEGHEWTGDFNPNLTIEL